MHTIDGLYAIFLLLSGSISAFAGGIILRRRSAPGASALAIFLFGTLVWSLTYALHWVSPTTAAKRFWLDMTYIGVVITPGAMVAFLMQFTHRGRFLRGRWMALLAIEPVITLLLMWTDPLHGLFYGGKRLANQSLIYDGGPWFWVNVIYSYSLIATGIGLLVDAMRRSRSIHRMQARLLLLGCLSPVAVNLVTFLGFKPFPGLDLTPIAFTLTGIFLAMGLVFYRLLDLVPIGRDVLVENMNEAMLLVDDRQLLLDFNPAARTLLSLGPGVEIGQPVESALAHLPRLLAYLTLEGETSFELNLQSGKPVYLEVQIRLIQDPVSHLTGRLIICHDITQQKLSQLHAEARLRQIEALQVSLKELAIRDPLTGAFNLRYVQETLPRELARAQRERKPLSLAMIDIDGFKRLNDSYGHPAGDMMLVHLCKILSSHTREGDILARMGGDEFLVVLPSVDIETARHRAEAWRQAFAESELCYKDFTLRGSFSLGLATFPAQASDAEELIRLADDALYQAKLAGRNRCIVAGMLDKFHTTGD